MGHDAGFLQGIKLAEEFVNENFEGHSVLSRVFNLHLQDRVVMKEENEARMLEALTTANSAKQTADSAKTTALRKRIQHAESKTEANRKNLVVIKVPHSSKRRKVSAGLLVKDDDEGPYRKLVTGHISHFLRKFSTRIGVVSDGHPSWTWYVGCLGAMQWDLQQARFDGPFAQ